MDAGPRSTREVFRGKLIRVEVQDWPHGEREVVHHPGSCGVVPLDPEGNVLLVRQRRESIDAKGLLEIPAGIFDVEGEDAAGCAVREVLEETGYRVTRLESLGSFYASPGFTDERFELFLAAAVPQGAPEEGIEVVRLSFDDALRATGDGRIRDAKSALALLLTASRRGGTSPS